MQGKYIHRAIESRISELLNEFPAVAILGPRQCGKSTLARHLTEDRKDCIFLDLELPSDRRKLSDPEMYLHMHRDSMICLDEVQRMPHLFEVLRSVIDKNARNSQFLILGSASRDLLRQSSETLAGRIAYCELTPFQLNEIIGPVSVQTESLQRTWLQGGFPRSYLARNPAASFRWRNQFIRTFLERDIPQLGFQIPAETLSRLWRMCAHSHGQLLNASKIGQSLGYSHTAIRRQLDLLVQTFMIRLLPPVKINGKKRLVKSPKIYIRDSGILHALLEIADMDMLFGHPVFGSSWEGFALEEIVSLHEGWRHGFYRTSAGAEIDLVLEQGRKRIGFEFKASTDPHVTRGFWNAVGDLQLDHVWIIAPVAEPYPLNENISVCSPAHVRV